MIKPEKNDEMKIKNEQAADIFLEILDTDDSESEDFERNVNQIFKKLINLGFHGLFNNSFIKGYSPEKAISIFELGLKLCPEHIDVLKFYTAFLYEHKQFKKAVPHLKKLVELEPESCYGWNFLGFALFNVESKSEKKLLGDPEKCYKKALELNQSYSEAWFNLGMYYKQEKRFKDAITCLEKVLESNPEDDFTLFALGHAHRIAGNEDLAIELYEKSLALNPRNDSAWNNLGYIYASRFEFKKAIQMYVRALQFNDESDITWYNLKYAYIGTEQFEKADYCEEKAVMLKNYYAQREDPSFKKREDKEAWYYS